MTVEIYSPFKPLKGSSKFIELRIEPFTSIGILSLSLFEEILLRTNGLSLIYFTFLLLSKTFGLYIFGA